jgi:ribosomal protein S1
MPSALTAEKVRIRNWNSLKTDEKKSFAVDTNGNSNVRGGVTVTLQAFPLV